MKRPNKRSGGALHKVSDSLNRDVDNMKGNTNGD